MAAYAALNSVMNILHDLQHHPSPPISLHKQQRQSLTQIVTSLQEFLESYKSPVADTDDEADPLEIRIAHEAYAAEDAIESHLTRTNHQQISCSSKQPENVDDEQTKSINFDQDLQRVIEEMDRIKQEAMRIKREAMQIDTMEEEAVYDHNISSSVAPSRSISSSNAMVHYNHLPVYLKPCFLYMGVYMGVFEEDDRIRVSTLINLWVSEGFLKPENDRSMEAIAMNCLKKLVDRNLILIDELGSTGKIKTCRIHDLFRDLCMIEGQRNGFLHVIGGSSPQAINRQCRRVFIPGKTLKKDVLKVLESIPHARSLICEFENVPQCRNVRLLRTLHGFKIDSSKLSSLATQYVNLRHLAIEVSSKSSFFSSFHLFWILHTLILHCRKDNESDFPSEIWIMPQFRHIQIVGSHWCLPDPPSDEGDDVVIMENLHVLKGVKNLKCCKEVVKRILNIKKLKISYTGKHEGTHHDDPYCVSNIESLCKLESLSVRCPDSNYGYVPYGSYLHKLRFPHFLKSLTLEPYCGFEWEAVLKTIGSLPHLEKLKLWGGWFKTEKWEIVEGQFPKLKYLRLRSCYLLKQWTVEGSFVLPHLENLLIIAQFELEEIPRGIGLIPTLKKVELKRCSISAVESAKVMVEEQVKLLGEPPLPFHVRVHLNMLDKNEELLDLADYNFTCYN